MHSLYFRISPLPEVTDEFSLWSFFEKSVYATEQLPQFAHQFVNTGFNEVIGS